MANRRNFIKQITTAGIASCFSSKVFSQSISIQQDVTEHNEEKNLIWANLLHLGYNMWEDKIPLKYNDPDFDCTTCQEAREWAHPYRPVLTFDDDTWDIILKEMAHAGMNMVVLDVGDAIQYESHPEIAVENAWTPNKLKLELAKMRKLGIEAIPKLNFASTHDIWLGEYSRMVSTDTYYAVCRDLIEEVISLFDNPRFFHLGMDEEEHVRHFKNHDLATVRHGNLWWADLYFFISQVEKRNVRPWIWSDYGWHYPDRFFKKMPKSVLQSNWYYGTEFTLDRKEIQLYNDLEKHGYDQIPTGSNHSSDLCMEGTVKYCKEIIDPSRLLGFMQTPWRPTLPACVDTHKEAIAQVERARKNNY